MRHLMTGIMARLLGHQIATEILIISPNLVGNGVSYLCCICLGVKLDVLGQVSERMVQSQGRNYCEGMPLLSEHKNRLCTIIQNGVTYSELNLCLMSGTGKLGEEKKVLEPLE